MAIDIKLIQIKIDWLSGLFDLKMESNRLVLSVSIAVILVFLLSFVGVHILLNLKPIYFLEKRLLFKVASTILTLCKTVIST